MTLPFYVGVVDLPDPTRIGERLVRHDRIVWYLQRGAPVTQTAIASFRRLSEAEQIAMLLGFNIHWPLEAARNNVAAALGEIFHLIATPDIVPECLREPAHRA